MPASSDPGPSFRRDLAHATAVFASGRFAAAKKLFHDLEERAGDQVEVLTRIGHLALLANRLDHAVDYLARALLLNQRSSSIWNLLAEAYYRRGDLGSAAYCYERLRRTEWAATLAGMADCTPFRLADPIRSTELPWTVAAPLPVVTVKVNGEPANLVIDTGAGDLVLDEGFAISAGVRFGGREARRFAGGRAARVWYGHLHTLRLGELTLLDLPVQTLSIGRIFQPYFTGLRVHGILGTAVLSRFVTTLDYPQRTLSLQRTLPVTDGVGVANPGKTAFWIAGSHYLVAEGSVAGSSPSLLFLDTGMTGAAFAIPHSTAEATGLLSISPRPETGHGGGGVVSGTRVRAESVCLGNVCRRGLQGVLLEEFPLELLFGFRIGGLLAHEFFHDRSLTLDFSTMELTMGARV